MKNPSEQKIRELLDRVALLESLLFKAENVVRLAVLYPTLLANIREALGIKETEP
jgi:hypothetical protein